MPVENELVDVFGRVELVDAPQVIEVWVSGPGFRDRGWGFGTEGRFRKCRNRRAGGDLRSRCSGVSGVPDTLAAIRKRKRPRWWAKPMSILVELRPDL